MAKSFVFGGLLGLLCLAGAFAQQDPNFIPGTSMVASNTVTAVKNLMTNACLDSITATVEQLERDLEPLVGYTCLLNKLDYTVDQLALLKLDTTVEGVSLALNCIPGNMDFADIVKASNKKGGASFPTGVKGCRMVVTSTKASSKSVKTAISNCSTCKKPTSANNLVDNLLQALGLKTSTGKTTLLGLDLNNLLGGSGLLGGGRGGLLGLGRKLRQVQNGLCDLVTSLGGRVGSQGLIDSLLGPSGTVGKLLSDLLGSKGVASVSKSGKISATSSSSRASAVSTKVICDTTVKTSGGKTRTVTKTVTVPSNVMLDKDQFVFTTNGGKVNVILVTGDVSFRQQAKKNGLMLDQGRCIPCSA